MGPLGGTAGARLRAFPGGGRRAARGEGAVIERYDALEAAMVREESNRNRIHVLSYARLASEKTPAGKTRALLDAPPLSPPPPASEIEPSHQCTKKEPPPAAGESAAAVASRLAATMPEVTVTAPAGGGPAGVSDGAGAGAAGGGAAGAARDSLGRAFDPELHKAGAD
ncbi:MAG: hypothetical protein LBC18_11050, partial [Opitutaceae bacterium]|nr:hypothetical protein [Opitutaceae bacterium]